ncbi:MAG: LacI family DNA-binding transcriptional regulator [Actinomycetota bacterium]
MSSIHDVAQAAGVSTATVSRALRGLPNVSEPTRLRIRSVADELGYVASSNASGLASGRTNTIGVAVPSVSRWFYTTVLEGVDFALRDAGFDMILYNLASRDGDRERAFHRSLLRKRTDALIAVGVDFTSAEREQLLSLGHPILAIGGPMPGIRNIGVDDRAVARLATEHLIGLGHRHIAHLGGPDDGGLNKRLPVERRAGFVDAMGAANLAVRDEWLLSGGFTCEGSREVMLRTLGASERPTAVFASSDEMAFGALLAAQQSGVRVPEDLSVIGIDDHEMATSFGLTTIAQDPHAQGIMGATVLLSEVRGGQPLRRTSIRADYELIVRTSTAPARPT